MNGDPNLSANLYADGLLDEVLQEVIAPFRAKLQGREGTPRLWTVRYNRRGEHLKVRLHIAPDLEEWAKGNLEDQAGRFFDAVDRPPAEERNLRNHSPIIDAEDEIESPAKDRSLLWTTYRRSSVTFGGEPLLEENRYLDHMTRCLSAGLGLLLTELESGGKCASLRQKLLLKALAVGLGATGLGTCEAAAEYLGYHRDWLLRFFIEDPSEEAKIRRQFSDLTAKMEGTVAALHQMSSGVWESSPSGEGEPWETSLAQLTAYLDPIRHQERYQVDPFAPDGAYPAFFKVFHGVANQYGLRPMEEAYTHHLLYAALAPEPASEPAPNGALKPAAAGSAL